MTVTTETALERLWKLQDILLDIRKKTERRDTVPEGLQHVEAAYREAQRRGEEARARQKEAESRKKVLESEVADWAEKLRKYQQQLASVKTNREYGALLNEIDTVRREVRTREDEVLALEEQLAGLTSEVAAHDRSFPEEQLSYEEQMGGFRAEQERLDREITEHRKVADEIRGLVEKRLLALFDRIANARAGVAVAKVQMIGQQNAACSACNVRIRPQLLADVRLSRETVYCESCKRILYWDDRTVVL